MTLSNIQQYEVILGSQSPRRQELLRTLGIDFRVIVSNVSEEYDSKMKADQVALYLAEKKAFAFYGSIADKQLVITSDTIVAVDDKILGKPQNREEAIEMLNLLSGRKHRVITGVCLLSKEKQRSFFSTTDVYFKKLSNQEIEHYISKYQPYDKAGAYGIQEWIGYIGIEKIEGSYFNVMGLPVQRLYEELVKY